jgi:AraC-like DNA-binding protein
MRRTEVEGGMASDILSDALKMVRLTGALMFRLDIKGRWRVANAATEASEMARLLPAGTDQIIVFHIVNEGECWMRHPPGDWVHTSAGEAVVLAHGAAHDICNCREATPVPFREVLGDRAFLDLRDLRFDLGPEPRVEIICGFLGCNRRAFAPLCAALPDFCKVRLSEAARGLVGYALSDALDERPGADSLRVHMAELLFMDALRQYMLDMPENTTGWLAGLRDPLVGRALRALHEHPSHDWSVDDLAAAIASSRSCLAARFRDIIGEPPMHYLTQLRMQLAARRLEESHQSIARVAEEIGYDSCAAFQRAFKRHFGVPPATWRRHLAQSGNRASSSRQFEKRVHDRRKVHH